MPYEPRYAEGQILVTLKPELEEEFAKQLGKLAGYELLDTYEGEDFLYKTKPGEENAAMQKFLSYTDFVEHAERFDLRIEERFNNVEHLDKLAREMDAHMEKDTAAYNNELEKIRAYIESIKEK